MSSWNIKIEKLYYRIVLYVKNIHTSSEIQENRIQDTLLYCILSILYLVPIG